MTAAMLVLLSASSMSFGIIRRRLHSSFLAIFCCVKIARGSFYASRRARFDLRFPSRELTRALPAPPFAPYDDDFISAILPSLYYEYFRRLARRQVHAATTEDDGRAPRPLAVAAGASIKPALRWRRDGWAHEHCARCLRFTLLSRAFMTLGSFYPA